MFNERELLNSGGEVMEHVEIKQFDSLKERYGNTDVYLSHTESFTLVAIPEWHWSFLWDISVNDLTAKKQCMDALSAAISQATAEVFVDELYNHLMMK